MLIARTATVMVFGLLAFAAGVCTILAAFRRAGRNRSHLLLWDGIAVSVVGLVTLLGSKLTLARFVYFIAAWAIVVGVPELLIAPSLRRHIPDEWSLTVAGVCPGHSRSLLHFRAKRPGSIPAAMARRLCGAQRNNHAGAGFSTL